MAAPFGFALTKYCLKLVFILEDKGGSPIVDAKDIL
jgi:hypothetical protein